jgi:hypothetical protein
MRERKEKTKEKTTKSRERRREVVNKSWEIKLFKTKIKMENEGSKKSEETEVRRWSPQGREK